jgi:hypothetical protein
MGKVKTSKLQMLRRDFETIYMKELDKIDSLLTQIIGLVNQITSYGETFEDGRVVEKILRSLPTIFESIVVSKKRQKIFHNFQLMSYMHLSFQMNID